MVPAPGVSPATRSQYCQGGPSTRIRSPNLVKSQPSTGAASPSAYSASKSVESLTARLPAPA
jgi:hypothetical protein